VRFDTLEEHISRRYAGTNLNAARAIDGRAKPVNQRFYYRECNRRAEWKRETRKGEGERERERARM